MKNIMIVLLFLSLGAAMLLNSLQEGKLTELKSQVENKKLALDSLSNSVHTALLLRQQDVWYVVDCDTVSTLPNGEGVKVDLVASPLRAMGGHLGIQGPTLNKKVLFFPAYQGQSGIAYSVAGGLLGYEYQN